MRALVIHAPKDLRLEQQEVGEIGPGQVMVRVEVGGICGSDLHYFNHGGFGTVRLKEPMILGHEVAGRVAKIAGDVTGVAVSDRVVVNPSRPCGVCKYCREGMPNQCLDMLFYGSAMRIPHIQGAFREALICEASQCVRIAGDVPTSLLALTEPFSVCLHAISRAGSLVGKRVLVTGCGPIGVLAVAAARFHGAATVVVTDVVDQPLAVARALGADVAINSASSAAWEAPYAVDKGTFDIVIECSGNERALRAGLEVVRPRGIVLQLGLGGDITVPLNMITTKEISLQGSFRFHSEFALAAKLISERRVDLTPVISGTYPIGEAQEAFKIASDRTRSMKVQLAFN
jgi:L-idonate 5-dehydrogenase